MIHTATLLNKIFEMAPEIILSEAEVTILLHETARGQEIPNQRDRFTSKDFIRGIFREGLLTINQVSSLLLAQKLKKYQTDQEAFRAIVYGKGMNGNGLIANSAILIPARLVGPLSFKGLYIDGLLISSDDGTLIIDPDILPMFKTIKEFSQKHIAKTPNELGPSSYMQEPPYGALRSGIVMMGGFRTGCPVAGACSPKTKSGLQSLTEVFYEVFERIDLRD